MIKLDGKNVHLLKKIKTVDNKIMIYYREIGSYTTDVKTKIIGEK